jgi:hypothetical protein
VEQDVCERLSLDLASVDLDDVVAADDRVQLARPAVHHHSAGEDELVRTAARGDACARQEGVETHVRILPVARVVP